MRPGKSKVNIEVLLLKKEEFQLQPQNCFEVLRKEGEVDMDEMVSKIPDTCLRNSQAATMAALWGFIDITHGPTGELSPC